ncbi:SHOCT domain-containing protein [Spongiactinospora sp. TRM90649]|uniref:SHOCT domain-containing protein n=1 Tax=Spongiactinospora sp. TRM90649 TaxID=3031114 RepID=UPI0023F89858|nr:SHOCT domain-containing protein [Spongiactinospora sp. TRM90649]MDF5758680.1 SHOCT domain-containing protein [Spongiactinospora sp. TRM90649]
MRLLLLPFLVVLIAAVVLGCMLVARWLSARAAPAVPPADDPREILKRRYAAGEIDEDEYLRRMSGLSQDW